MSSVFKGIQEGISVESYKGVALGPRMELLCPENINDCMGRGTGAFWEVIMSENNYCLASNVQTLKRAWHLGVVGSSYLLIKLITVINRTAHALRWAWHLDLVGGGVCTLGASKRMTVREKIEQLWRRTHWLDKTVHRNFPLHPLKHLTIVQNIQEQTIVNLVIFI